MEHDGHVQQTTEERTDLLAEQLQDARLVSASSSTTSIGSGVTVIAPAQTPISPQVIAEALQLYQQRNKRQRTNSGDPQNGDSSKKKRPLLSPAADTLYKKARNAFGKVAKHEAMAQGIRRYKGFGEHIVPATIKVSEQLFLSISYLSQFKLECAPLTQSLLIKLASFCLPKQIKNSIPTGMGDEQLIKEWKDIKMATEKRLMESQLSYALRVAAINRQTYDEAISGLKNLVNDEEIYQNCLAATRTCAEVHRVREQNKQMKMWTEALTNYETQGTVKKARKGNKPQGKRNNRRDNTSSAIPGPSAWLPRQNNGRPVRHAQRRLPATFQNNRGRQLPEPDIVTRTIHATIAALHQN